MPQLQVKGFKIDPTDCVLREARRLGAVREEAVPWLAEEIARWYRHGNVGQRIRATGHLLEPEELRALGLRGNVKISREVISTLTGKGLKDPMHLFDLTCTAIVRCLLHEAQQLELQKLAQHRIKIIVGVEYRTGPQPPCRYARALAGQRFRLGEQPPQPLPECDADVCGCGYRYLTKPRFEGG